MASTSPSPTVTAAKHADPRAAAVSRRIVVEPAGHRAESRAAMCTEDGPMVTAVSARSGRDESGSLMDAAFAGAYERTSRGLPCG
jgi:hypothetical protein